MRARWIVVGALALACGGTVAPATGPDASALVCGLPPRDLGGDAAPRGDTIAFAIRKIYLGDTDRNGVPSHDAWRAFGYDIDGITTTRETSGSCMPRSGAAMSSQLDGDCGMDNSLGANLVPIYLSTFGLDYASQIEASIAAGGFTDIIVVDSRAVSASGVVTQGAFLNGATLSHAPAWNGADEWPVDSSSLSGGAPRVTFDRAYVAGGTWVGAPRSGAGAITLGTFNGYPLRVPVDRLLVTMRIAPGGGAATSGVISGVVRVEPYLEALGKIFWQPRCYPECWSCVEDQIREASDVLADGTVDPTRPCDAISIGIGFEASAVRVGPTVDVPPRPDPCAIPDAGSSE